MRSSSIYHSAKHDIEGVRFAQPDQQVYVLVLKNNQCTRKIIIQTDNSTRTSGALEI